MQWSCPHCGISLTVSDEMLGTGWSFSRCYKCGGFALIRRAEINIIKVDKAPPGERVLLPEASQTSQHELVSENATQKIAKHVQKNKPLNMKMPAFPEPLPEFPTQKSKFPTIPKEVFATGLLALVSGIYLYVQGQALLAKAHNAFQGQTSSNAPAHVSMTSHETPSAVITDQVQQSAMAPVQPPTPVAPPLAKPEPTTPHYLVKLRAKTANLHSGPGIKYPIIGKAVADTQYRIADWNDRWFNLNTDQGPKGWIRNDLVQILPEHSSGNTAPNINPLNQ